MTESSKSRLKTFCKVIPALAFGAGLILGFNPVPSVSLAAEMDSSYARGGQLYDKWFKVVGTKAPKISHALYPKNRKYAKKPGANWRCKECHGWDGKGKDGAYSKGKHFSGIKGVNGMWGGDPAKVVAVLKGRDHGYADKLSSTDLTDLANFVTKGMIDMDKYIDRKTKNPIGGNAARGAAYFNTVCANCHRKDGSRPKDMGKSLASQMGNPWEVAHKIISGQPDEKMPALRAFGMQPVVDILAHIKTLPKKKLK